MAERRMRNIARFALVGAGATVVDVGLYLLFAIGLGWPLWWANLVALWVSALFGVSIHQNFTLPDDPERAYLRSPRRMAVLSLRAAIADLSVVALLEWTLAPEAAWAQAGVKLPALALAAAIRVIGYRSSMFVLIRAGQDHPAHRPPSVGDVRLTVVIPAYREADRIADSVRRVRADLATYEQDGGLEILVVDDGSPDDTSEQARLGGADRVVRLDPNGGKGGAVRRGMIEARGRTVVFTDADLSYPPRQIPPLVDAVESGFDVAVGSRRHTETVALVRAGRLREIGGRVVNLLTAIVLLGGYRDTQCGIKAFRGDVAKVLFRRSQVDGFGFDVELFHLIERYRLTLAELPVQVENTTRSTVRIVTDTRRLVGDLFKVRARARLGLYEPLDGELPEPAPVGH